MMSMSKQYIYLATFLAAVALSFGWTTTTTSSTMPAFASSSLLGRSFPTPSSAYKRSTRLNEKEDGDGNVIEDSREAVNEAIDDAADTADEIRDQSRDYAYDVHDKIAEKAEDAKEAIDEARAWEEKSILENKQLNHSCSSEYNRMI